MCYYGLVDDTVRRVIHAFMGFVRRLFGYSYPCFTTISTPYDGFLYGRSSNIILDLFINPRMTGLKK